MLLSENLVFNSTKEKTRMRTYSDFGDAPNETVTIIWVFEHKIHEKTKNGDSMEAAKNLRLFLIILIF